MSVVYGLWVYWASLVSQPLRGVCLPGTIPPMDGMARALLPARELIAHEADLLPQVADHARGAAGPQLDHGGHDLDHAPIEVNGAAGLDLVGATLALEGGTVLDERERMSPVLAG